MRAGRCAPRSWRRSPSRFDRAPAPRNPGGGGTFGVLDRSSIFFNRVPVQEKRARCTRVPRIFHAHPERNDEMIKADHISLEVQGSERHHGRVPLRKGPVSCTGRALSGGALPLPGLPKAPWSAVSCFRDLPGACRCGLGNHPGLSGAAFLSRMRLLGVLRVRR